MSAAAALAVPLNEARDGRGSTRAARPAAGDARATPDAFYRMLVESVVDDAIVMLDPDGFVTTWNAGAERTKGYPTEEIVGQHVSLFYTEEDAAAGRPAAALATARARGSFKGEGWRRRRDGSRFWAGVVIGPIHDATGTFVGFATITRDLTERKLWEDKLSEATRTLDLALANMSQGLCVFDAQERLMLTNAQFRTMFGLEEHQVQPGRTYTSLLQDIFAEHADAPEVFDRMVRMILTRHRKAMARPGSTPLIELVRRGRVLVVTRQPLPDGGWVSTTEDITARRAAEKRVERLAHFDALTGLANRVTFREALASALRSQRPGAAPTLLFIDLDGFKEVNDLRGHRDGDAVLRTVAKRLGRIARPTDVICRLGGDEFIVLIPACAEQAEAARLAQRLLAAIARPIPLRGGSVTMGASVGIATAGPGVDADRLIRNADLALYGAKAAGGGCDRAYAEGMEFALHRRAALAQDLRAALREGHFSLRYQPVLDMRDRSVKAFEALLRWHCPSRGEVPPIDFIPFAEEAGLMADIDDWVLATACREAVHWPEDIKVAVNLSATSLRRADLGQRIAAVLGATGLPARRLEIEVTETAMIHSSSEAGALLRGIRALGVGVALDDFGTGYSSLSFLLTLPFTRIKIDRTFVRKLGLLAEATAIVRAVVGLARELGAELTAEGVETMDQLRMLADEGISQVQGYLVGRPAPAPLAAWWDGSGEALGRLEDRRGAPLASAADACAAPPVRGPVA